MTCLAVNTDHDRLLSALAPIGLATAATTALVVDLETSGVPFPGQRSLADLVRDGPTRAELLQPTKPGVALLRNGGVDIKDAWETVDLLAMHWPAVVLRTVANDLPVPVIPVIPLYPGWMKPRSDRPAVWQTMSASQEPPGPGPVLPPLPRSRILSVCEGRLPTRGRWVRAWRAVWEASWR